MTPRRPKRPTGRPRRRWLALGRLQARDGSQPGSIRGDTAGANAGAGAARPRRPPRAEAASGRAQEMESHQETASQLELRAP
jgi:hypothetical protein